jgi:hypothetical protein
MAHALCGASERFQSDGRLKICAADKQDREYI